MLDDLLRPVKERLLTPAAAAVRGRVSPMTVTILGFAFGMAAAAFAARGDHLTALWLWIANRILDGFDGTLARTQKAQTDLGGYVDIVLDFVVYAAIPIALVLWDGSMAVAIAGLLMLGSFYVNAVSWMYLSAILERRGAGARARGELTTVTMPEGLIGGTETMVLFTLFLLLPHWLAMLFGLTALLVGVTAAQRLVWATRRL